MAFQDNIKEGSKLRSNDKRTEGKIIEVTGIYTDFHGRQYAVYQAGRRKSKVRFDQIVPENGYIARGWTLVGVNA